MYVNSDCEKMHGDYRIKLSQYFDLDVSNFFFYIFLSLAAGYRNVTDAISNPYKGEIA